MELKADKDNPAEQRLLEVFNEQASASLKARVADGKKTIRGALAYLTDYARKKYAKGGTAVMDSDEIIGQFFHYLEEDSLDFEGKAPCAKVAATPNLPASGTKPKPKKKKEDPHPQLSFVDALFSAGRPEPAPADPAPVPDGAHARKLPPKKDDCETTPDYWDCECGPGASGFAHVHHKSEDRCPACGARREDQPDSRVSEVRMMLEGI